MAGITRFGEAYDPDMMAEEFRKDLGRRGGIAEGHFVVGPGRHSSVFIEKDILNRHPSLLEKWAHRLARRIEKELLEALEDREELVIVSPLGGASFLGQRVAHLLAQEYRVQEVRVNFAYAELYAENGEKKRRLRPVFAQAVENKAVAIIEDFVMTGSTIRSLVEAIGGYRGEVVLVGILWLRGELFLKEAPVESLINEHLDSWLPANCPLCSAGIPLKDA
jgi:orotate phosphoribosyltransferase